MNFPKDFVKQFHQHKDGVSHAIPFLFGILPKVASFYHYHLFSESFITDYLESNGEVYGNQELDEFREFYRYLLIQNQTVEPEFTMLSPPINKLDRPEYFMAQFHRYPLKEWIDHLVWLIDMYKRYQIIKQTLDCYSEDELHQVFFEWKIEELFELVEPLLLLFRVHHVYI